MNLGTSSSSQENNKKVVKLNNGIKILLYLLKRS
ncbi:MAG: hypothetical protein ACI9DK_003381, partial [Vicingaceae bacterium]